LGSATHLVNLSYVSFRQACIFLWRLPSSPINYFSGECFSSRTISNRYSHFSVILWRESACISYSYLISSSLISVTYLLYLSTSSSFCCVIALASS
jgi:hypothetical protein